MHPSYYYSLRQYPLYSKKEPPAVLASHFEKDTFAKSQAYGKDKAKYSLISGLIRQGLDSLMIHYGAYYWAWEMGGKFIAKLGYGPEYEVRWISDVFIAAIYSGSDCCE